MAAVPIVEVDDRNFEEFMSRRLVVLVLGESGCGACAEYNAKLERVVGKGEYRGVAFGKLVLDKPGGAQIKRRNPWIAGLKTLPYTVLYREGEKVDEFATIFAEHLEQKLREKFFQQPPPAGG